MNKDLDERILPNGQYRDAMNIQISSSTAVKSEPGDVNIPGSGSFSGIGNIGALQNIPGNEEVATASTTTDYISFLSNGVTLVGNESRIIASIADESKNKSYYFCASPVPIDGILSILQNSVTDSGNNGVINGERTWVDSIIEVSADGPNDTSKFIFVDKFAITNTVANAFPGVTTVNSTIVTVDDGSKYRVGMRIYANKTSNGTSLLRNTHNQPYVEIMSITGNNLQLDTEINVDLSDAYSVAFIYPQRVLEFDYYNGDAYGSFNIIPSSSINILDNLLMWSDGKHEPKKINIDRCEAGTNIDGVANDGKTHTKLFVKDPKGSELISIDTLEYIPSTLINLTTDVLHEHVTTIKKAPTLSPVIDMAVSDRNPSLIDFPLGDFQIVQDINGDGSININDSAFVAGDEIQITFPNNVDFRIDDIYTFTSANSSEEYTFRAQITDIDDDNPQLATLDLLFVDSEINGGSSSFNPSNWIVTLETQRPIFEAKFGRFAYRYKYEDNECSSFGPWSELAFLPGRFNYTPSKGFNEGMSNTVRNLVVKNFLPIIFSRPLDVKTVEILWKTTDNQNVYVVKSITRGIDEEWKDMVVNNTNLQQTGELVIKSELIYKVVEANQLLRSWDNVPRHARAQGITSNRLVYGNYTQGYDINAKVGLQQSVISKKFAFPNPQKSVKSLREYQFGIVIGDRYGRETPVISGGYKKVNQDGTIQVIPSTSKLDKKTAPLSNKFKLKQRWQDSNPTEIEWMDYVKYYVKETSNEYYNLVLDRWYDAGDDNIWLSFNSADRNKVDEETYLILKNEHGSQTAITQEARYKILAIENEAPEFVKATNHDYPLVKITPKHIYGAAAGANPDYLGDGGLGGTALDSFPNNIIASGGTGGEDGWVANQSGTDKILSDNFIADDYPEFKGIPKVRIVGKFTDSSGVKFEAKSPFRVVTQVLDNSAGEKGVGIREEFLKGDVWMYQKIANQGASLPSTASAVAQDQPEYFMELRDQVLENKAEFEGKFFVKIAKDAVLENSVLTDNLGGYEVVSSFNVAYMAAAQTNPAIDNNDFSGDMDFEASNWEMLGGFTAANIASSNTSPVNSQGDTFTQMEFGSNNNATAVFWNTWYNNADRTADIFIDEMPASSGYRKDGFSPDAQPLFDMPILDSETEIYDNASTSNYQFNRQFIPAGLSSGGMQDGTLGQLTFSIVGKIEDANNEHGEWSGANAFFRDNMEQDGSLFRFANDPNLTVYRINTQWQETYTDNNGELQFVVPTIRIRSKNYQTGWPSYRDRSTIIVRFERVDGNNQPLGTGLDAQVWDPRGTIKHNGLGSLQIEFVRKALITSNTEQSITTTAACFETEPKEDVGLDIYYEASPAIPIRLNKKNIFSYVGANFTREKASTFSVGNRQVAFQSSNVSVNIQGQPFVTSCINDNVIEVKNKNVNGVDTLLTTSVSPGYLNLDQSDGVCAAIKDFVSFTDKNGLVVKSRIKDHMQLTSSSSSVAKLSNRYSFTTTTSFNDPFNMFTNYGTSLLVIDSADANSGNIVAGMEVVDNSSNVHISAGTFVKTVDNAGFQINVYLNQPLIVDGSIDNPGSFDVTFIEVTGRFKISKEVWQFPIELPWFNCYSFGNGVESDRIRDDFNTPQIDNGVKVSSTFLEYGEETKGSSMIYSGIYNSTSSVNNLSEFNMAEKITKDLNTTYGSIQAMKARDNDVVVFAEDKVLRVQSGGKDALFNADGNSQLTATDKVLGTAMPFAGDYGISKNPESLAVEAYRMYFSDKQRGAVLRLSRNGITPISDVGMKTYFKNKLKYHTNISGSYDGINDEYNIVLHATPQYSFNSDEAKCISYSESSKGWISFKSFTPITAVSVSDRYYSVNLNKVWKHSSDVDDEINRNRFYGQSENERVDSTVDVIFNQAPSNVKTFKTISYEGSQGRVNQLSTVNQQNSNINGVSGISSTTDGEFYNINFKEGWYVDAIQTDLDPITQGIQNPILPFKGGGFVPEFIEKEGKWHNYIRKYDTDNESTSPNIKIDTSQSNIQGLGFLLNNPTLFQSTQSTQVDATDSEGNALPQ